jgi:hypothetical protein
MPTRRRRNWVLVLPAQPFVPLKLEPQAAGD